ncbi:MAG: NAD-binding protein [Planctomycetes bacterium]|nr:NAD-binding protein [Planctomycetota bacterium]
MRIRVRRLLARPGADLAVLCLILFWVLSLILEILSEDPGSRDLFRAGGHWITLLFWIELGLRFWVAPSRLRFFQEYWLDLVSVIPVPDGVGALPLRLFRLIRVVRLFRVGVIVNRRFTRITSSMFEGSTQAVLILAILSAVVLFGSVGLYHVEHTFARNLSGFEGALWFTLFSLAAVQPTGAPDYTTAGRVITLVLVLSGMTFFAMMNAVVTALVTERLRRHLEASPMDLEMLENHIVVCGWNASGFLLLQQIQTSETGDTPIVIIAEVDVQVRSRASRPELIFLLRGDPTRLDNLRAAGVERARLAVLLADQTVARTEQDRDARSILTALMVEKLNPRIHSCVELLNSDNEAHIKMAGVEDVVVPFEWGAHIMSTLAVHQAIARAHEELLDRKRGNSFFVMECPAWAPGLTFVEAARRMKADADMILVGLEEQVARPCREGERHCAEAVLNPPAGRAIQAADRLIVMARNAPANHA